MLTKVYRFKFLLDVQENGKLKKTPIVASALAAIAIVGLFLAMAASGVLVSSQTVPNSGIVAASANVGVYSDYSCTQSVSSISWGTISPSSSITRTVYVKNTGSPQLTLSMTKTNWNPASADGPITLTWDRESTQLTANQVTLATLTLSASSNTNGITTFSFNVVISGTG